MQINEIFTLMKQYDTSPEKLKKQNLNALDQQVQKFMIDWFQQCEDEYFGKQYEYVWKLVYGWEFKEISGNSLMITQLTSEQNQKFVQNISADKQKIISKQQIQVKNYLEFIDKSQAIIKIDGSLILINPKGTNYQFQSYKSVTIILTTANIQILITSYQIKQIFDQAVLISSQKIYLKFQKLSKFIYQQQTHFQNDSMPLINKCFLLKKDEYFIYQPILIKIHQNFWFEPSYDLQIIVGSKVKKKFLIQQKKIEETKLIYYAQKKGCISGQMYESYVQQNEDIGITSSQGCIHQIFIDTNVKKRCMEDYYLAFSKNKFIAKLQDYQKQEIFNCSEILEYIKGQVIVKKGCKSDFVYFVIEGHFAAEGSQIDVKQIGLNQLLQSQNNYQTTFQSRSHGILLRCSFHSLRFILYDNLS